jgi:hypothetical protein
MLHDLLHDGYVKGHVIARSCVDLCTVVVFVALLGS